MSEHGDARLELRAWLGDNWDPQLSLLEWRRRLAAARWACPSWPERWSGRGWPASTAAMIADEFERIGAPGLPEGVGMMLAAPTILEHGGDAAREQFLLPTVIGELSWCQLFSE